jgi:hypothetical protein
VLRERERTVKKFMVHLTVTTPDEVEHFNGNKTEIDTTCVRRFIHDMIGSDATGEIIGLMMDEALGEDSWIEVGTVSDIRT